MNPKRSFGSFENWLLVLGLCYLLVFAGLPLLYNLVMSFQEVDTMAPGNWWARPWVGFANYIDVLQRPEARGVWVNTGIFIVLSLVFQVGLGFGLALLFQEAFLGATVMRGLFLAGWIMPGLVAGVIWKLMFAGDFGVLNHVLLTLGLAKESIYWLSDARYALYAVVIANVWLGVPFNMLLLSAGLAQIPKDLYEAAELDGAGTWQRFYTITLPMMQSTLGAVIALGVIMTIQQFDLVAALTQGGPANASQVAQYWSWQLSFQTFEIAPGSAVASLMLVAVVATAVVYVRATRHERWV
ncbi:MAG: sugar ABC transporter permease [Rhodoferax sp.]|uniref:carbohydrate ABC transporter permease n=1 Tax=Rhodoferax sp. TaxID=50421 RepID=UPI00326690C8